MIEIRKNHLIWVNTSGRLHRENGPAVEWDDGAKSWYINGKRHREDGPAIEYSNGAKSWCINGGSLTEDEFNRWKNED